jgi:hypothetical protein
VGHEWEFTHGCVCAVCVIEEDLKRVEGGERGRGGKASVVCDVCQE